MLSASSFRELLDAPLTELMPAAAARRDARTGRRITFAPKICAPLTMLCRDRCGYCTFAKPPARLSHLMRALMILVIELPQMVLGAILSLTTRDIYPVYDICGRVLDMTALNDLHYGGLIIWLPGTLTSFGAMIVVLTTMRLNEERAEKARTKT